MIKLRVPATSANMGAGFDTLGVAVGLYNRMMIEEIPEGLEVINKNTQSFIPQDTSNLIYRAMAELFDYVGYEQKGYRITQDSQIPMTRGLGSSSACIIGGMLAANIISGRQLSYQEIIHLAAKMEGHPDNVGPALFGGFCVSLMDDDKTIIKSTKLKSHIKFAVIIPDFFVATQASPLFVHLVENGYTDFNNPVTRLVAEEYLTPIKEQKVDTLILGCTHYPVIADLIGDIMGRDVALISPGAETAGYAKKCLAEQNLLSDRTEKGKNTYYVSDSVSLFTENAAHFLQEEVSGAVYQSSWQKEAGC